MLNMRRIRAGINLKIQSSKTPFIVNTDRHDLSLSEIITA